MRVEEFDFAIYGSGLDAAFLAAELVQRHTARVLLVRDHVNDYTLQHHHDFSAGGNCDPDTIRMVQLGLERWHALFSGRAGRASFDRGPLALKVADRQNEELLQFIEGALTACDRQFERRAVREGAEYLILRDVIAPKRTKALEFLHTTFLGVGLEVHDRSQFQNAKRLKDGKLTMIADGTRYRANQTVIFDEDLIKSHASASLREALKPVVGTKITFEPIIKRRKPPTLFVDSQLCVRTSSDGNIHISAPLEFEELVARAKVELLALGQMKIMAQGAFQSVVSRDGAPVLTAGDQQNTWIFNGGTIRTFLMPGVSDIITKTGNSTAEQYWANRGEGRNRLADISPPYPFTKEAKDAAI